MIWAKKIIQIPFQRLLQNVNPYIITVLSIGLTTLICSPLSNSPNYHVVSLIMLFVVSILSTFLGIGPVLLASSLFALVWNYFFIPPHFTFHIDKTEDILMFCMFFIIALLNGIMTTRIKRQEQIALDKEEKTNALFQLTRELSKASGISEVIKVANENLKKNFSIIPFFILQDGNNLLVNSQRLHSNKKYDAEVFEIANIVFKNREKAGDSTTTFPNSKYFFLPISGMKIDPGVLFFEMNKSLTNERESLFEAMIMLISNALEREFLGEIAQKARLLDESDRLYKTLFNSISHELRIPVATIIGASDTLLTGSHQVNVQSALLTEISTASLRLNRLIENLLNMSRLESGRISPRLNWYDINDLANKVVIDLKEELKPFNFEVEIPEDIPLIKIDFGLMEQVLYNLLINSCEHSPIASIIKLEVSTDNDSIQFKILDRGTGFPEDSLRFLFQKFYRVDGNKSGGLGLGLSIVKGFVEAHKGTVSVENRKNGGAKFIVRIPLHKLEMENNLLVNE